MKTPPLQGVQAMERCTFLLLYPSPWKNYIDDYLWGDFQYHQKFFSFLQFLQLLHQQLTSFSLRKHHSSWYLWTKGCRREVQQVCSFYCPYLENRRWETSIQSDIQFLNHTANFFRLQHFQM